LDLILWFLTVTTIFSAGWCILLSAYFIVRLCYYKFKYNNNASPSLRNSEYEKLTGSSSPYVVAIENAYRISFYALAQASVLSLFLWFLSSDSNQEMAHSMFSRFVTLCVILYIIQVSKQILVTMSAPDATKKPDKLLKMISEYSKKVLICGLAMGLLHWFLY